MRAPAAPGPVGARRPGSQLVRVRFPATLGSVFLFSSGGGGFVCFVKLRGAGGYHGGGGGGGGGGDKSTENYKMVAGKRKGKR